MAQMYVWVAQTKKGRKLKGETEAASEQIARAQLKKRNLTVLKIKPKPKDLFEGLSFMQPKVKKKDLVIFTRQFSTMIDAGLPLVQGLNILAEQSTNPTFRVILKQITKDVEGGSTLAEALRKHPKVFDNLFVNLVAAGEVGGILDTILQRLAIFIEKAEDLKSKIKGALTYPIVVVCIAVIVIAVILIFVIPVFQDMFASFGSALPMPTQIVVNMSNFMKSYWYLIFIAFFVLGFAFKNYRNTKGGRKATDGVAIILLLGSALLGLGILRNRFARKPAESASLERRAATLRVFFLLHHAFPEKHESPGRTAEHGFHPGLMLQVPTHGLADALLEGVGGHPSQFALHFAGVNRVAPVVAGPILDESDQLPGMAT